MKFDRGVLNSSPSQPFSGQSKCPPLGEDPNFAFHSNSINVVPFFNGHSYIQAGVPTLRVSLHQGDRYSGMGVGGVARGFGYGYENALCACIVYICNSYSVYQRSQIVFGRTGQPT